MLDSRPPATTPAPARSSNARAVAKGLTFRPAEGHREGHARLVEDAPEGAAGEAEERASRPSAKPRSSRPGTSARGAGEEGSEGRLTAWSARSALSRFVRVEPGEGAGLAWSALSFFFLLGGYYVIRPLRDEMGASTGGGFALNWLFFGTLAGTLLVNPLFGALVSRIPRRVFVPAVYHAFAASFVAFFVAAHVSRRARAHRRGALLLRLRERLQPPRRVGLLGLPRRPLPLRAGQAPLRVHRPRRHAGRHPGRRAHGRARAALGPVPLLLVAAALFEVGVLCLHRLARVFRVDEARRASGAAETRPKASRPARALSRA